ncbi:MAG: hypothetical protein M3540_01530 [Actinomycetota bacterium]|nr:hypothetical protein [Actinomycetota bacterium]
MLISSFPRGTCTVLVALFLAAGCGGGGGGTSADDVASRIGDRINSDASCTETTEEGSDRQTFSCTATYSGQDANIGVIEDDKGTLTATVTVGGAVKDFFVLD